MAKAKPKLHLIKPTNDRLAWNSELDWYYSVFDAVSGLHSIPLSAPIEKHRGSVKPQAKWRPPETFHPSPPQLSDFGRARRIWQRLQRITWAARQALARWYDPRQYWHEEHPWFQYMRDNQTPPEVKAAHEEYLRG